MEVETEEIDDRTFWVNSFRVFPLVMATVGLVPVLCYVSPPDNTTVESFAYGCAAVCVVSHITAGIGSFFRAEKTADKFLESIRKDDEDCFHHNLY